MSALQQDDAGKKRAADPKKARQTKEDLAGVGGAFSFVDLRLKVKAPKTSKLELLPYSLRP